MQRDTHHRNGESLTVLSTLIFSVMRAFCLDVSLIHKNLPVDATHFSISGVKSL